jgi:DNA-binding LacI/PurR family transcriptional regulator
MKTRPTIGDVAKAAGVSKSTVSRVLNNRTHHMADETHEKVLQAIQELHYHPSSIARSLVSKKTLSVGLLISDVANPFYPEVIQGVEDIALKHGYQVFLSNTNYDAERGLKFVRSLVDKRVDGVMVMTSNVTDSLIQELTQNNLPVVVLDWELKHVDGVVGAISVDFETGIHDAVKLLFDLGHRRVAHISGPLDLRTSRVRQDIFIKTAENLGIESQNIITVEGDFQVKSGRDAVKKLLELHQPPTAVFAANDLMAVGFISGARENGCLVPGDISVIGLDDIQLSSLFYPSLSTVSLNRKEIGNLAMKMLLDLMDVTEPETKPIFRKQVSSFLIVRDSTSGVKRESR